MLTTSRQLYLSLDSFLLLGRLSLVSIQEASAVNEMISLLLLFRFLTTEQNECLREKVVVREESGDVEKMTKTTETDGGEDASYMRL